MAKKTAGRGRPRKNTSVGTSPLVWGNDAHDRFRKVLSEIRPAGCDLETPAALQQILLHRWPAPANIDPEGHACIASDRGKRCSVCHRRHRLAETIVKQCGLSKNGHAVQWAVGFLIDAMDVWYLHPRWRTIGIGVDDAVCLNGLPDELWFKIPADSISDHLGGLSIATPENERQPQGESPSAKVPGKWLIGFPAAPRESDVDGWKRWLKESREIVTTIGNEGMVRAKAIMAAENKRPYPTDDELRLFAWYQVGGLELEESALACGLHYSKSRLSRLTKEVAIVLGVTKCDRRGRHNKLRETPGLLQ